MTSPTPRVFLDDGTGTYPTEITSKVRWTDGYTLSGYGRSDETPYATSATLSLVIDNADGSFSSGATAVAPGTGIRVSLTSGATTVNRFTGRVSSLELGWPTGGQEFSTVLLQAVDPLAELSRRVLRSMFEQEILKAAPAAYYTLGEAAGATAAADTSGNAETPLLSTALGTGSITFGTDLGLPDAGTGVSMAKGAGLSVAILSKGPFDTATIPATWTSASLSLTAVFMQNGFTTGLGSPLANINIATGSGTIGIIFDSTGHATFNGCTSPANLMDGLPHIITVQAGLGLSTDMWVDGVKVSTAATLANTWDNASVVLEVSPATNAVTVWAHFAYGSRTSDAQVLNIHQAGLAAITESTDSRLTRLASYVGGTATTTSPSGQTVKAQATSGASALDALQQVATAEQGVFYADGSGALQMQGRTYRAAKTTATLALPAEEPDPATTVPWDTQQLINTITVTRTGGGAAQTYADPSATSSTGPGTFPTTLDTIVADDASALALGQWIVNKHKTTYPRITTLTVNGLAPITSAVNLLSLKIGDRISLSMPSQNWSGAGDYTIEGWSETVSATSWSITFNVLPWQLFQSGIWGNAGSVWDTAIWGA